MLDDALDLLEVDAKLVLGQASGDVAMGVSTHVGVDAQGDAGHLALLPGELVDDE